MSCREPFVRHHKIQTDLVIHRAYKRLAADALVLQKFEELLHIVRNRARSILDARVTDDHHPGIEAVVNLARFHAKHLRPAADWLGSASTWRAAISQLAHHLVCRYAVPMFLASSWQATDPMRDEKRAWFLSHASGVRFRSLNLPIAMTRNMERIFLASPDHLSIEQAMRRAELLSLGAPVEIVRAVMSTRLAAHLRNGDFWPSVWRFFIANANDLDPAQIGPVIDFLEAVRHECVTLQTPDGTMELQPPRPKFSMKGRTLQSMLRLVRDWHRLLGVGGSDLSWTASPFRGMLVQEPMQDPSAPLVRWHMTELTTAAQLRAEGTALHHCVASYARLCQSGISRIWSLRLYRGEHIKHMLTIEINPKLRTIVQARGFANRPASGRPRQLLQRWATQEKLTVAV